MQVLHDVAAAQVKKIFVDTLVARATPLPVSLVGQGMLEGNALTQLRPTQRSQLSLAQLPWEPLVRVDTPTATALARDRSHRSHVEK
jgi:hypothetical protein